MPHELNDPQQLAELRALLDNPENWQSAAMPRRLLPPQLPGEFMKAPSKIMSRVGLPTEFGPYARAADDVTTGISNAVGSAGPAAEAALEALKKFLSRY